MLLVRGQNCEEAARTALGEGEESLKEKFRSLSLNIIWVEKLKQFIKVGPNK